MMIPVYHNYVLSWWLTDPQHRQGWRFVLESLADGQKRGFTDIDDLIAAIRQEFEGVCSLEEKIAAGEPSP